MSSALMTAPIRFLTCLALYFSIIAGLAFAFELDPVELEVGTDGPVLNAHILYAKGLDEPVSFRSIVNNAEKFSRIDTQSIHFGLPDDRVVVLLQVHNNSPSAGNWILTTGRGSLRNFMLFDVAHVHTTTLLDGTDLDVVRENLSTFHSFSGEILLRAGETKLYAIEFEAPESTFLPLQIQTYGTFFKQRRSNLVFVSATVAGILSIVFLNVVFFTLTGQRAFIWLGIAELAFAINILHTEGYTTIFYLFDKPVFAGIVRDLLKVIFSIFMVQFARSILRTKEHFPKVDVALRALIFTGVVMCVLQLGAWVYPEGLRTILFTAGWLLVVLVSLFLPGLGLAATMLRNVEWWPLTVAWGSLGLFIIYSAIASAGVFSLLPINWHMAGPIGLIEAVFATLALGLYMRRLQANRVASEAKLASSLAEQLKISQEAQRLVEEKATAIATVNDQNLLLHASGHDTRQVLMALNSAITVVDGHQDDLADLLRASVSYLTDIVSTTMAGASMGSNKLDFLALQSITVEELIAPLKMMYEPLFRDKGIAFLVELKQNFVLITDKALLSSLLSNILSNSLNYTDEGEVILSIDTDGDRIQIGCADTGIGMSKEALAAVMLQNDKRYKSDLSSDGEGTGLIVAQRIASNLGSELEFASSIGQGTTVTIGLRGYADVTPCSIEHLSREVRGLQVRDVDTNESLGHASVIGDGWIVVGATFDDSLATRSLLSKLYKIVLIKPVCEEMVSGLQQWHSDFVDDEAEA